MNEELVKELRTNEKHAGMLGLQDGARLFRKAANELERLSAVVDDTFAVLSSAPELNPSNYNHEDACELNAKSIEAWAILNYAHEADELANQKDKP
jgi:hypothetical protein